MRGRSTLRGAASRAAGASGRAAMLLLGACALALHAGACSKHAPQDPCAQLACIPDAGGTPATIGFDAAHDAAPPVADAAPQLPIAPRGPAPSPQACTPDGPSPDALGSALSVLYTGPRQLSALASSSSGLFVVDAKDGIFRVPAAGGALERVASAGGVSEILAADLHLYWFQNGSIWKTSLSATNATPELVGGGLQHAVSYFNFDAANLYFADVPGHTLLRFPLDGTPPTTIVSGVAANDMKLRSGLLYYADAPGLQVARVSILEGSSPETLTTGSTFGVGAVESDGTTLYWADGGEIRSTPIGQPAVRKPLARGGPGPGGSAFGLITRMLLIGQRLYFLDDGGNVGWTALDGSSCGLVVKGAGTASGLDVDDTAVYLTVAMLPGSQLWRIPHP